MVSPCKYGQSIRIPHKTAKPFFFGVEDFYSGADRTLLKYPAGSIAPTGCDRNAQPVPYSHASLSVIYHCSCWGSVKISGKISRSLRPGNASNQPRLGSASKADPILPGRSARLSLRQSSRESGGSRCTLLERTAF